MKKLLIFAVVAIFGLSVANAQTALIATLSHNGEITVFNGSGALNHALYEAETGDVITLSGGIFTAPDITKGVTIRGAGMFEENDGTSIIGDFCVDSTDPFYIEGVSFLGKMLLQNSWGNSTFSKCKIHQAVYKKSYSNTTSSIYGLNLINCFVDYEFDLTSNEKWTHSVTFTNSVIMNPKFRDKQGDSYNFTNCVLTDVYPSYIKWATIKNTIVIKRESEKTSSFGSNNNFIYSKIFNNGSDVDSHGTHSTSSTGMPTFKDGERYELSDETVAMWLGNDGTQVGIYGGLVPFDPTPAGPQITKFNVGHKTSADGKLTVDLEVKTVN